MPIPRVGGLDDPIWAQSAEDEPVAPDGRRVQLIIAVATIGTALLLGYLGWSLPVVGAPLTYPTLIVFGTGVAIGAIGWVIGERRHLGARRALLFPGIAVALAIAGAAWTFEFSLPASVWFSDAGQQAEAALMAAGHAPKDRWGESAVPCNVVTTGRIGPLRAPYQVCTLLTAHEVLFSEIGAHSGLAYLAVANDAGYFGDECSRHLWGRWWMYRWPTTTNGIAGCPIGYRFHGGA